MSICDDWGSVATGGALRAALLSVLLAATALTAGCDRVGGLAPLFSGSDNASGAGSIVVNKGDSIYVLARRYQVPLRALIDANNLKPPYVIEPGQRLVLPTARQYIVQPGDTLYGISRMFGVDVSELTRLNSLTPPYAIRSGQPLRLPSPSVGYGEEVARAAPRGRIEKTDQSPPSPPTTTETAAVPYNPAAPSVTFQPGQEPKSLRPAGSQPAPVVPPSSTVSSAPASPAAVAPSQPALPAAKPTPAAKPAEAKPVEPKPEDVKAAELKEEVAKEAEEAKTPAPAPAASPAPVKSGKPTPPAVVPAAAPAPVQTKVATVEAPPKPAEPAPPAHGGRGFMMPVKGAVISGYGPKPGGLHNDGLNIGAPKGTAVVAADNGVVAYAGNELRGFGNLLLIRHADGWITAYAHLDRIDVERGAEVKRGQKIGTVGQSGGVPTPQLHFELRKGNQAVDPTDRVS